MKLHSVEFYGTPEGDVMIKKAGTPVLVYEISDKAFTRLLICYIREFYPEAYKALCEIYTKVNFNQATYEYRIAHRFIRCNFNEYDNENDIDHRGSFNFEEVKCPLRGECKVEGIVCKPKFNSNLTDRELEVMRLLYLGKTVETTADDLIISIETVRTHRRNSLQKLGLHSMNEFNAYANSNHMFTND